MRKMSVVMLLAGICFGSAFTMMMMADRLDEAADYVAKVSRKNILAEAKIDQLQDQMKMYQHELQEAIDSIPPNADQCWASFRKMERRVASR